MAPTTRRPWSSAMRTAGSAVVFSGTTVAVGLLALVVLPLPFLRSVGYGGMLIPLVSVVVACTLLPAVLASVGPRMDWPRIRREDRASRSWTRWAELVSRRRAPAAALAIIVLGALLLAAVSIQPGDPKADSLSKTGDARAGLVALEHSGIGPGVLTPMEIPVPSVAARGVTGRLAGVAGVRMAIAPAGLGWKVGVDSVVDVLPVADGTSNGARATLGRVRTSVRRLVARGPGGRPAGPERGLRLGGLRQLPAHDRADRGAHLPAAGARVPVDRAAAQGGRAQRRLGGRRVGARSRWCGRTARART